MKQKLLGVKKEPSLHYSIHFCRFSICEAMVAIGSANDAFFCETFIFLVLMNVGNDSVPREDGSKWKDAI